MRRRQSVLALGAVTVLALFAAACAAPEPSGGSGSSPGSTSTGKPSDGTASPADPSAEPTADATDAPLPDAGTASPEPGSPVRGLPDGVEGTMESRAGAGWAPAAGQLYVVTYGSSTCARVAEPEAAWDDAHETVVVTIQEPAADAICTMDYVPTTSLVVVPGDVADTAPVAVRLGDDGPLEVAPRAAAGETGPMAWLAAG
ncbi:hypothetical protein GCM10009809_12230 [Isoptericola hypogeus]|uniref:Uncharacterized protein n=1 Tax=Isoptericola hypogeus TaxID=300179 RepID=A0ABP4V4S1_9MICO